MKKSKIITLIAILSMIVIMFIVAMTVKRVNTSILENYEFYQYYGGRKVSYTGTIVLESKNNISEVKTEDNRIQLDSTPIYYEDIYNKVLFPKNMAVVYPIANGLMYKMNRFSNIKEANGGFYLEKEEQDKTLENVFLYDGVDMYFFLENITIHIEDKEYKITPLSYAKVQYNGNVEIYNKEEDKYIVIEGNFKNVLAKSEDYTVNMSIDAIQYGEKQQLLIKLIDSLQNLE